MSSEIIVSAISGPSGGPVSFPNGINFGAGVVSSINNIGVPGAQGFGVGICPNLPAGYAALSGTTDPASSNYGNYQYSDGSIMVWIPAFFYKIGTGSNGLAVNQVSVQPFGTYKDVPTANAAGYALHRAFYDAGAIQEGFFVDKYLCSNNGGTASSIVNGLPLSSASTHNPFSGLTGAPANAYYGAIQAAQTRGSKFFCSSIFINKALALLALAHAQAATANTWCAWYDATGVTNFPKGCNNNALGDANDSSITYVWDGYAGNNSAKTGSASLSDRTTHNGQWCGVADLNGCMWEINPGLAVDSTGANFYILNTAATMHLMTGGNTASTDFWGSSGLAAWSTSLGATYGALTASSTGKTIGSATQVLSEATSGLAWEATGAGIPLVGGVGGSNAFGLDVLWDYRPADMCPLSGGMWASGSGAGVWALNLGTPRAGSDGSGGFRAASYL
ncbi:MAG: hypothetical protein KGL39_11250 [Patescibacteria group bacterium]|nr:hypothetical protein [Patescibacteria group bacterium]